MISNLPFQIVNRRPANVKSWPNQGFGGQIEFLVIVTLLAIAIAGFVIGFSKSVHQGHSAIVAALVGLAFALAHLGVILLFVYGLIWSLEWKSIPKKGTRVEIGFGPHKGNHGTVCGCRFFPTPTARVQLEATGEVVFFEGRTLHKQTSNEGPPDIHLT